MSPQPLIPDAPEIDQVPLAIRAVLASFATAIGWLGFLTFATLAVGSDSVAATATEIDPDALHVNLLLYGFTAGIIVTGLVCWLLLRTVASTWRRFALAVVGVLGGFTVGMVVTLFARGLGGQTALLVVGVLGLLAAWRLAIGARRLAANPVP